MASLYDEGWRQGTIFEAVLPLDPVVLSKWSGRPARRTGSHNRWVIAAQDCDLDQTAIADAAPKIELRPVYTEDPPQDWGLRSAKLRLTEMDYVESTSPRTLVSAAVLTTLKNDGVAITQTSFQRRRAFTIWLGKRYDRPAVPPELGPLAKEIAKVVGARRNRQTGARVRDVLMQFDESASPPRFSLFAVLENEADEDDVRTWLSAISLEIPTHLGLADQIEAATTRGISLELIETSYSADVTQVTWRRNNPDPEGAI
jgi:hypothetical protein